MELCENMFVSMVMLKIRLYNVSVNKYKVK